MLSNINTLSIRHCQDRILLAYRAAAVSGSRAEDCASHSEEAVASLNG